MVASSAKPSAPRVPIRSPLPGPELPEFRPPPLPHDPFPPQFLERGETVLASITPLLRAYLGWPALLLAAISLAGLAGLYALASADAPVPALLFLVFAGGFVASNLLWSRWRGRNLLLLLPIGFFVGFIVSAFAAAPSQTITPGQVRSIALAEIPAFAVLSVALPLALSLIAWSRAAYAVTNERVLEVRGVYARVTRWIALEHVGTIRGELSVSGRPFGFGRIRFEDRTPSRGHRTSWLARLSPHGPTGAEFFGVASPSELAGRFEEIVSVARPAPPSPVPSPAAPTAPAAGSEAPLCPTCRTSATFVPSARRFYCTTCARYLAPS